MRVIDCMIVDDEPLAQEVIKQYISKVDRLRLVACSQNANQAYEALHTHRSIELLFLDIEMPSISGIDFLKSLRHPPHVIFTTANREYALVGFDLNAVDYILKPCSFPRFLQSVNKAFALLEAEPVSPLISLPALQETTETFIVIKVDGKLIKVEHDSILFVEAYGEYVKVITPQGTYLSLSSLKSVEEKLPSHKFARTHRSFLVALRAISFVEGNVVHINSHEIPISRNLRDEFMLRFTQRSLL